MKIYKTLQDALDSIPKYCPNGATRYVEAEKIKFKSTEQCSKCYYYKKMFVGTLNVNNIGEKDVYGNKCSCKKREHCLIGKILFKINKLIKE